MADERDERDEENGPKIRIVDRRMLNDDERAGRGPAPVEASAPPKLEMIEGGAASAQQPEPNSVPDAPAEPESPAGEPLLDPRQPAPMGDPDMDDDVPMTAEELEQVRQEMLAAETEQFAALEERMGRPLTEKEKDAVRLEMERQAQSMTSLEVEPILANMMAELSARAAVHMGLMPNPYTRLIAKNDAQARMAIDAFSAIYDVLKPQLDPNSQREYARVLNDLRVNFVSVTGTPLTGPSRIIH